MGINGRFNITGNDGTLPRFGWKAQNKSLLIFAGEAYNVEQGVSNEVFPNERSAVRAASSTCSPRTPPPFSDPTEPHADTVSFANFMRLAAPPTPTTSTASEKNGQNLFNLIGCAPLPFDRPRRRRLPLHRRRVQHVYHPYSDFALHNMGAGLADGVVQGTADVDEFRTAPLWGLGQRLFFLHDGRTSDLMEAITRPLQRRYRLRCLRRSPSARLQPELQLRSQRSHRTLQRAPHIPEAGPLEFPPLSLKRLIGARGDHARRGRYTTACESHPAIVLRISRCSAAGRRSRRVPASC